MQWPISPTRFNLRRMVEISGVKASTIRQWQHREIMKVARIGAGTDRSYTLSDALHAAIISQMSRLGLSIASHGAELADALLGWAIMHLREDREIARLKPVALIPIPNERDWSIEPRLDRAAEAGSYVVINLGRIAGEEAQRYSIICNRLSHLFIGHECGPPILRLISRWKQFLLFRREICLFFCSDRCDTSETFRS